jgi:hypothetical protein
MAAGAATVSSPLKFIPRSQEVILSSGDGSSNTRGQTQGLCVGLLVTV